MNTKYARPCGKKPFLSRAEAAMVGIKYSHRAYRCPNCKFWHLTKKK